MRLSGLGIDRNLQTVVVLGAGASRGASCSGMGTVIPPLDADFFALAQQLPPSTLLKRDRDLFSFIRTEFGMTSWPTLETFFTQVEAVDRFHHEFNIRGRVSGQFRRQLDTLRRLIPRVFAAALKDQDCLWHERLAFSLRAGDAILSFNYDTLVDRALRTAGGKRWQPDVGYGFNMVIGSELWEPQPSPGPKVTNPVLLLKPHGSLNWTVDGSTESVALVTEYEPATSQSIVPPTWDKSDVSKWPWNEVWRSSRKVLASARMLVVVGYSVPLTDQLTQALLRADVSSLAALVVVNPDPAARRRVIETLSSALGAKAQVVELETLSQIGERLPPHAAEPESRDLPVELTQLRKSLRHIEIRGRHLSDATDQLRSDVDDLELRLDDLDSTLEEQPTEVELDHIRDELQHLSSDVVDIDLRLDSLAQDRLP